MCGIVGYVGLHEEDAVPFLLEGLKKLEYRGYDSAGLSICKEGQLINRRAVGKLRALEANVSDNPLSSHIGIAHTRWATHGKPNERNCHPITSETIAVVHNGIIENFADLKDNLKQQGYVFYSDTDTEVITAILSKSLEQGHDIESAFSELRKSIQGHYSLAFIYSHEPDTIYVTRQGCPLCLGKAEGGVMIASDAMALELRARNVCYLEDGDYAVITKDNIRICDNANNCVTRHYHAISHLHKPSDKGNYRHYMLKEIHEQPEIVNQVLGKYIYQPDKKINLPELSFNPKDISHIVLCGCGTAYYAALIAKYWLEKYAKITVSVEVGSELRYTDMPFKKDMVGVFISQSGETLDTLSAMRKFKENGVKTLTIVNVPQSTIMREADTVLEIYAGQEIGVASTKAMMCQLVTLALFAIQMGVLRDIITPSYSEQLIDELYLVPRLINKALQNEGDIANFAKKMSKKDNIIFVGRHIAYPLALEGALKLKEISYIHAEGYIAGELKHGPLALLDEETPVVAIAPQSIAYEKTMSNISEAVSRGCELIFLSDTDVKDEFTNNVIFSIKMPKRRQMSLYICLFYN